MEDFPSDTFVAAFMQPYVMEKLELLECLNFLEASPHYICSRPYVNLLHASFSSTDLKPSKKEPPKLELKPLPTHLHYAYLGDTQHFQ